MNTHQTPDIQAADPHYVTAAFKLAVSWVLVVVSNFVSNLTLQQLVLFSTLMFTTLQTFFLLRDKWWRERKKKAAK